MDSFAWSWSASAAREASVASHNNINSGLHKDGSLSHITSTFPWLMQGIIHEPIYLPQLPNKYHSRKRSYVDDEAEIEELALACLEDPIEEQPPLKRRRSEELACPLPLYSWQTPEGNSPVAYEPLRASPSPPFSWQAHTDKFPGTFEHLNTSPPPAFSWQAPRVNSVTASEPLFPWQTTTGQATSTTEAPIGHYYLPPYVPSLPSPGPTYLDYVPESKFLPHVPATGSNEDHHTGASSPNTSLLDTQHVQNAIEKAMQSSKVFSGSFSVENLLSDPLKSDIEDDYVIPKTFHLAEDTSLPSCTIVEESSIQHRNCLKQFRPKEHHEAIVSTTSEPIKQVATFSKPLVDPTGHVIAGTTIETAVGPVAISYSLPTTNRTKESKAINTKTRRLPVECGICHKHYENNYKLKVHMNSHTGNRPYVCDICNKGFMRSHHLTAHRRLHDPLSRYPCPRCGQEFKQNKDRLNHVVTEVCIRRDQHLRQEAHGGWTCITCSGTFQNQKSARAHATTHNRKIGQTKHLTCPWCQADFTGRRECTLVSHCIEMHKDHLQSLGVY